MIGRWIGYHAAAFALPAGFYAFEDASFFTTLLVGGWTWVIAGSLGLGVALAQWGALRPAPEARAVALRTLLGLLIGTLAGLGAGHAVAHFMASRLADIYMIGMAVAWGWIVAALSEGLFLALAHQSRSPAWGWGLGFGWAAVRALPGALFLALDQPLNVWGLPFRESGMLDVAMFALSGAGFGLLTLPLLKHACVGRRV